MKSDLEKMRDVMEEIHGSQTGLRYSNASRRGADIAERARGPKQYHPPKKKDPAPIVTRDYMTAREERETARLIGTGTAPWWQPNGRMLDRAIAAVLVLSALCGALYGALWLQAPDVGLPLRILAGAVGAPVALTALTFLAIALVRLLVEKIIPALIAVALAFGLVYLVLLLVSGQL